MFLLPKYFIRLYFLNGKPVYQVRERQFFFFSSLYNETNNTDLACEWLTNLEAYSKLTDLL